MGNIYIRKLKKKEAIIARTYDRQILFNRKENKVVVFSLYATVWENKDIDSQSLDVKQVQRQLKQLTQRWNREILTWNARIYWVGVANLGDRNPPPPPGKFMYSIQITDTSLSDPTPSPN